MQTRNSNLSKGIDISHYQGSVDFAKVKAAGIGAVIIKATDFSGGTPWIDPNFAINCKNAIAAGLPFGCYHFMHASVNPTAQAQHFWNTIKGSGFVCLPALDWETPRGESPATPQQVLNFLLEFESLSGIRPMLYGSTSPLHSWITAGGMEKLFTAYPLWVAHYGVQEPGDNGIWQSYAGWQYTSTGQIDGISGNVDVDVFTKDVFIPVPVPKPTFPGAQYFGPGKTNDYIMKLDKALIAKGYSKYYQLGVNGASNTWGNGTQKAVQAFQLNQGWRGSGADGFPGPLTWNRLFK